MWKSLSPLQTSSPPGGSHSHAGVEPLSHKKGLRGKRWAQMWPVSSLLSPLGSAPAVSLFQPRWEAQPLSGIYPETHVPWVLVSQVDFTKGLEVPWRVHMVPHAANNFKQHLFDGFKVLSPTSANKKRPVVLCPIHPTILPRAHPSPTREIKIFLPPLPRQFSSPAPRGANTKAFRGPGPALHGRHVWLYISFFPSALMDWGWRSHQEASAYIWITHLTYINSSGGGGFSFVSTSEILYSVLGNRLVSLSLKDRRLPSHQ